MLENIPSQSTMMELLGQPLFEVWQLKECDIEYIHPIMEHSWGQRVVRFYDPDKHIIEVGENMKVICRRFLDSGSCGGVV